MAPFLKTGMYSTVPVRGNYQYLDTYKTGPGTYGTIPYITIHLSTRFGSLLKGMLENGAVNNPANIRSGFAACGIYPLDPQRVLSRLPPEQMRRSVQTEFDRQLLEELQKNRYGDPAKKTRAKKANRLPAGVSYTVGARGDEQEDEDDPQEGPSGLQQPARAARGARGSGGVRGMASRGAKRRLIPALDTSSGSEDNEENEEVIHTDYLGADPDGPSDSESSDSSESSEENEETSGVFVVSSNVDEPELECKQKKNQQQEKEQKKVYDVGDFVTAVYEGQWLIAQVDINQDLASDTHVNLSYMHRIGHNQFKWPKDHDLLLTLKEDILTQCTTPVLVGSSIRANLVGLKPSEAQEADAALAAMVYLQPIQYEKFLQIYITVPATYHFLNMIPYLI